MYIFFDFSAGQKGNRGSGGATQTSGEKGINMLLDTCIFQYTAQGKDRRFKMSTFPETGFSGVWSKQTKLVWVLGRVGEEECGRLSNMAILPFVMFTSYPNTEHFLRHWFESTLFAFFNL